MDTATVQQPVFLPLDSVELIFLMIKVNVHISKLLKMYPENSEHFQFSISVSFFFHLYYVRYFSWIKLFVFFTSLNSNNVQISCPFYRCSAEAGRG